MEALYEKLRQKEAERKKYLELLEKNTQIAGQVDRVIRERDFEKIFAMIEQENFIAEERYIQFYITKIKNEENVKLYNAIAANAEKHRAYLCIVGVCSFYGWSTEADIEVARHCLLKSAQKNCTYAQAFIAREYLTGGEQMVDEQTARGYLEKLTAIASPIMLYYYGMALSHGGKNGGSNFIKNNYDDAVLYLEYAANCYIEEAKKSLEDWEKLLRS